jgi:hypothetical protein
MRRILFALVLFCAAGALQAQSWAVIDGGPTPRVLSGNIAPTVQRPAAGFYRVTLAQPSRFVLATSITGGPAGDAASTLVSVRFDTTNPRVLFVTIFAIGTAGSATKLTPIDGRFSIEVRPGS